MRLVDHDRVVAGRDFADLADHERELLQRRDDDPRLLPRQRLGELIGVVVDLHDHAASVLELVDRVLELAVEDHAIGDHDHLVEHLVVLRIVKRREPVRRPRDRVRLSRARRVLDQIRMTGSVRTRVRLKLHDRIPLVIARENHALCCSPSGHRSLLGSLDVDEAMQDVEPGILAPDPLPEIRGLVAVRVRRIALPEVVAEVEREEPR